MEEEKLEERKKDVKKWWNEHKDLDICIKKTIELLKDKTGIIEVLQINNVATCKVETEFYCIQVKIEKITNKGGQA